MINYFRKFLAAICVTLLAFPLASFKLDRVILATDENPTYIQFWPVTSSMWQQIVQTRPTLALIAHDYSKLDNGTGDVVRFDPIPGIPTWFQAQVIRILLPALFPEDVCIISDIDMIPLQKNYFTDSVAHLPLDHFAVYRDKAYGHHAPKYPMCYVAAQGKVFAEIFNVYTKEDIILKIKEWYAHGHGWVTDEKMLHRHLTQWHKFSTHCSLLGHDGGPRIDRSNWQYDPAKLKNGHYIDSHMVRPYHNHKDKIDTLIADCLAK